MSGNRPTAFELSYRAEQQRAALVRSAIQFVQKAVGCVDPDQRDSALREIKAGIEKPTFGQGGKR